MVDTADPISTTRYHPAINGLAEGGSRQLSNWRIMAMTTHYSQKYRAKVLPTVAAVFFAYFVVAVSLMQVVRPDCTVDDHMISDHAVGQSSWVMSTASVSAALGCLALAIGLFLCDPKSWLGRISAALLVMAFVGLAFEKG